MRWFKNLFARKPKFEIGDIVKCVDDRDHIVKYGQEYKVLDRCRTTCCGDWCYDVGLKTDCGRFTNCTCEGEPHIQGKGIHWAAEFRFAFLRKEKAKLQEAISIETKEILKKETEKISKN